MIQEEIQGTIISTSIKSMEAILDVAKLLTNLLINGKNGGIKHGEQSMKQLNKQNTQLEPIPIANEDVKAFKRELKKQGVDFTVMKDKTTGESKIFFKGRDIEQIKFVLENYAVTSLEQDKKPNIEETFKQAKERADKENSKAQEKTKDRTKTKAQER